MKVHDYEMRSMVMRILAGCILYNLILVLAALLFYPRRTVLAGIIVGMTAAVLMTIHMAYSVSAAMKTGNPEAVRHRVTISSTLRKTVFAIVFLIVVIKFSNLVNPLALVVGAMGLKAGAYFSAIWEQRRRKEEVA